MKRKIIVTDFEIISNNRKGKANESTLNMVWFIAIKFMRYIKWIELKKGGMTQIVGLHVPPCDSLCPSQLGHPN